MSEPSFDKDEWLKTYASLPRERQDLLDQWFATQALIVENLGIDEKEWFGAVFWALHNPEDFSFMEGFRAGAQEEADAREGVDPEREAARAMVGGETSHHAVEGEGVRKGATGEGLEKELFQRFMADHMNESPRGAARRTKGSPPPSKPEPRTKGSGSGPKRRGGVE